MAVQALMQKRVNRIVLARPAVEAGEKLGFLPGDLQDKVDPYLRPLYDALFDLVDYEKVTRLLEKRVIEVAPLAFMRGRTLSDAFIILDEAQNTTSEQMKNVSHSNRFWVEGSNHRRYNSDRPACRTQVRPCRSTESCIGCGRASNLFTSTRKTW
jgi:hypothetical protein